MEKIKRALDRARNEQGNTAKPDSLDKPSQERRSVNAESPITVENINYQETKVLKTDQEVLRRNLLVVGGTEHPAAETAYKILRTQVEQRLVARGWNSLAITSPGANVGKTITAINLSMALAQEMHRTVLLVDMDFRNPNIHRRLGCEIDYGLIDYLLDGVPLNKILINPGVERLVILPAGKKAVPNSSELLSSPKMISLVDELKTRYPARIIVFDLPPLLWSDDALAFSPYVDATLLVVSEGLTTKQELTRVREILDGENLLGTVLNRASEAQPTYYYK